MSEPHDAHGHDEDPVQHALDALEAARNLQRQLPDSPAARRELAHRHLDLAGLLATESDGEGAIEHAGEALDLLRELLPDDDVEDEVVPEVAAIDTLTSSDPFLLLDIALAHQRLGDGNLTLGERELAAEHGELALRLCQRMAEEDPGELAAQHGCCLAFDLLGRVDEELGRSARALERYSAAVDIGEALIGTGLADAFDLPLTMAQAIEAIARLQHAKGERKLARAASERAVGQARMAAATFPDDLGRQQILADCLERLAELRAEVGLLQPAVDAIREAVYVRILTARLDPTDPELRWDLSRTLDSAGALLRRAGDLPAARRRLRSCARWTRRLAVTEPERIDSQHDLALSLFNAASVDLDLHDLGELPPGGLHETLDLLQEADEVIGHLRDEHPQDSRLHRLQIWIADSTGSALRALGHVQQAENALERALAEARVLIERCPDEGHYLRDEYLVLVRLGDLHQERGNGSRALELHREALSAASTMTSLDPTNVDWQSDEAFSHDRMAVLMQFFRDHEAAEEHMRRSLEIRRSMARWGEEDALAADQRAASAERLGELQAARGKVEDAARSFGEALTLRERLLAQQPGRRTSHLRLAITCWKAATCARRADPRRRELLERGHQVLSQLDGDLDREMRSWLERFSEELGT